MFRCGLEDHSIGKSPKPDTLDNKIHWNMEKTKTCAYRSNKIEKTSENSTGERESQKIYTSMAHRSSNVECPRRNYGDISQLTNWILNSVDTCHMTPEISGFIPG